VVLRHVQSLLREDGKIKGNNTDPYSVIGSPQRISLASSLSDDAESATSGPQNQQVLSDSVRDKSTNARTSSWPFSSCSDSSAPKGRRPAAWTPW